MEEPDPWQSRIPQGKPLGSRATPGLDAEESGWNHRRVGSHLMELKGSRPTMGRVPTSSEQLAFGPISEQAALGGS